MTDNTTAPGGDTLELILAEYRRKLSSHVFTVEDTAWKATENRKQLTNATEYVVAALEAYILAEVQKAKPKHKTDVEGQHPDHTPEQLTRVTAMNRSYNQGIEEFEQAAIARFGKGGNRG